MFSWVTQQQPIVEASSLSQRGFLTKEKERLNKIPIWRANEKLLQYSSNLLIMDLNIIRLKITQYFPNYAWINSILNYSYHTSYPHFF